MSTTSSLLQDTVGKIYKARTHIPAGEPGDTPFPNLFKAPRRQQERGPGSRESPSIESVPLDARGASGGAECPGGALGLTSAPGRNANPQRVAHGVDLDDPEFDPPKSQI